MSLDGVYDERAQKFWSLYVKEAEQHDKSMTETWKSDMDSTLIFAGLFSATVTAFIIESYKLLQADSGNATTALLAQILAAQIVGASLNTSAIPFPTNISSPTFRPAPSAVAVNILWFLSLACSLAAALCVTLVQQWTRDYLQRIERTNQPQRRATIRGIMFAGSEKWKMDEVVEYIPTLLHMSLFLFFSGLCVFLWSIDVATAATVVAIFICCLSFYGLATVAPLFDLSAPYETPLSSPLWHLIPHRNTASADGSYLGSKSLTQAREYLASSPLSSISSKDSEALVVLHRNTQAVAWVYDRITDDPELLEFVGSLPGFLSSHDGPIAWDVFFSRNPRIAQEVGVRIGRLLNSCATPGYLDVPTRRKRAMSCVDALLAISSVYEHFTIPSNDLELDKFIVTSWDDDNILSTKCTCLMAILHPREYSQSLLSWPNEYESASFRGLSANVDKALKDIDEMRLILEDILRQAHNNLLQSQKADIAMLLRVYISVVQEKTLVLNHWIYRMIRTGLDLDNPDLDNAVPAPLIDNFKSWYYSLPRKGLRLSYEGIISLPGCLELDLHVYQILAFLRLHGVYTPLSHTVERASHYNPEILSTLWFPLTDEVPISSRSGWRTFRPFGQDSKSSIEDTASSSTPFNPIDSESAIYNHLCRELMPISSLLDLLDATPATSVTVHVNARQEAPLWEGAIAPCVSPTEGPFSSFASILEAVVKDQGICGGLLELVILLKRYFTHRTLRPSIITEWLETICPPLSNPHTPMSKASQILLVVALREILAWEDHASVEAPCLLSQDDVERLLDLLDNLTNRLPVAMAEHALGTTLDGDEGSYHIYHRVRCIRDHIDTRRSSFPNQ